jgi:hypothetical protein
MEGYSWLAIPLGLLAFACIVHGIPSLITYEKHNHYHGKDKE